MQGKCTQNLHMTFRNRNRSQSHCRERAQNLAGSHSLQEHNSAKTQNIFVTISDILRSAWRGWEV
eukprot:4298201-Amphidinium_carterae.1